MEKKTNTKKPYDKPELKTREGSEVVSDLGPARAVYGETGPNP
jgi:hypothetical protein